MPIARLALAATLLGALTTGCGFTPYRHIGAAPSTSPSTKPAPVGAVRHPRAVSVQTAQ